MRLGESIRARRDASGLSLRDLAGILGATPSYLSLLESGKRQPGLAFIPVVASFLGISAEDLLKKIAAEKVEDQASRIEGVVPLLSPERIESIAIADRDSFLAKRGRDSLIFPADRDKIPQILCGLNVIYDDELYREGRSGVGEQFIFAGLFPERQRYRGMSNVIVVARRSVSHFGDSRVSEPTLTFQVLHELGHFRLHWKTQAPGTVPAIPDKPVFCSSGERSSLEYQANAYASSFLMPENELRNMMHGNTLLDERRLCNHFFVEPHTLRFRLKRLGIKAAV